MNTKFSEWALRLLNFRGPQEGADYLYNESKIIKLRSIIIIANCSFVYLINRKIIHQKLSVVISSLKTLNWINKIVGKTDLLGQLKRQWVIDLILSQTLKAIKQWNKIQRFINIYSWEMTYPKFLRSVQKHIESQ